MDQLLKRKEKKMPHLNYEANAGVDEQHIGFIVGKKCKKCGKVVEAVGVNCIENHNKDQSIEDHNEDQKEHRCIEDHNEDQKEDHSKFFKEHCSEIYKKNNRAHSIPNIDIMDKDLTLYVRVDNKIDEYPLKNVFESHSGLLFRTAKLIEGIVLIVTTIEGEEVECKKNNDDNEEGKKKDHVIEVEK